MSLKPGEKLKYNKSIQCTLDMENFDKSLK